LLYDININHKRPEGIEHILQGFIRMGTVGLDLQLGNQQGVPSANGALFADL
jgi:hypothetical protein